MSNLRCSWVGTKLGVCNLGWC